MSKGIPHALGTIKMPQMAAIMLAGEERVTGRHDPDSLLGFLQYTSFRQTQLAWKPGREDSSWHWCLLNGNPPSATNITDPTVCTGLSFRNAANVFSFFPFLLSHLLRVTVWPASRRHIKITQCCCDTVIRHDKCCPSLNARTHALAHFKSYFCLSLNAL